MAGPTWARNRSIAALTGGSAAWSGRPRRRLSPALCNPTREIRLAQPSLLDLPRATTHGGPVLDAFRVGIGRAELVLLGVLVAVGLDEGDQRRVERRRVLPDLLEHDPAVAEDRDRGCVSQSLRRAVDMEYVGAGVGLALREHDPVGLDLSHVAEPDYIIDLLECIDFTGTEHRDPVHRRASRRIDADQAPRCFQSIEQVLDVRRLRSCLASREMPSMFSPTRSSG